MSMPFTKFHSIADVEAMVNAGALPGIQTLADAKHLAQLRMKQEVALVMGIPAQRIKRFLIDEVPGMPEKVAVEVEFDPELSEEEHVLFMDAMGLVAGLHGSRPPIWMPKA